ncbi:TVP38/TMEM64 family protein [Paracerasibacillus soli]|uniref:TVP38/TMEM64 family membrane protein n=1 Tax=Paracerasibacillus soli TaxID=480284 RepID=A0ABU5CQL0_9BACI|nr:VTT domain-containing protein [Virgibacillus soli]MDY0408631.1 VTT domain-containing protein [Virgibacillus soli]
MEQAGQYVMVFIETAGLFAPLIFISFHLLRPLFFVPVVFICVSGGILFGAFAGTLYSLIGITLSSIVFYLIVQWAPKTLQRFVNLRKRLLKNTEFTTTQIAVLRLIPFIHFHLLSLCLLELSRNFKDYAKASIVSNIPIAFVYTTLGQWISTLSPLFVLIILLLFIPLIYVLRRKEIIIKWQDFSKLPHKGEESGQKG